MTRTLPCFFLLGALEACTVRVFSPPSLTLPLESSAPLGTGKRVVRGEISGGAQLFGPGLSAYRGEFAQGVSDELNVSVAASAIALHSVPAGNPHTGIYSARVGVKYAPVRYVALSSGLAPGASAGGGFLAYDAGLTAAGENPFAVPFVTARGLFSLPVGARRVRIVTNDDADEDRHDGNTDPDVFFRTPTFTRGFQLGAGLKVPLRHVQVARALPSLACAIAMTRLNTKHGDAGFLTLGCGVEVGL